MKPAVDEMFPEGAGPYVDLDEVRGGRGAAGAACVGPWRGRPLVAVVGEALLLSACFPGRRKHRAADGPGCQRESRARRLLQR